MRYRNELSLFDCDGGLITDPECGFNSSNQAFDADDIADLEVRLAELNIRAQQFIRAKFGVGEPNSKSYAMIGAECGMSRESVRKVVTEGLRQLRFRLIPR